MRRFLAVLAFWGVHSSGIAALPTAQEFAKEPEFEGARLSPDGTHVGMLRQSGKGSALVVFDVVAQKAAGLNTRYSGYTEASGMPVGVIDFQWVGGGRLLLRANVTFVGGGSNTGSMLFDPSSDRNFSGYSACELDGSKHTKIPGTPAYGKPRLEPGVASDLQWHAGTIAVVPDDPGAFYAWAHQSEWTDFPGAVRIDTRSGAVDWLSRSAPPIRRWLFGTQRRLLGVAEKDGTARLMQQTGGEWHEVADFGDAPDRLVFHAYDAPRNKVYVARPAASGRLALHAYDIGAKSWGEPLLQHPRYDVGADLPRLLYGGHRLTEPLFSKVDGRLLGLGLVGDGPRQHWFDERIAAAVRQVNASFPDVFNQIVGIDDAETRLLCFSWSAREPGFYSVVDLANGRITRLVNTRPWLKAEDMGKVFPVKFPARDETEVDAYLTVPPGRDPKGLPCVLLVRAEPWRRTVWGFDPDAQFLATRGYAVLQINHRGSTGFGEKFAEEGRDSVGGTVQHDLIDGVRWASGRGIIDGKRVAVVGESFGGFSALWAMANEPALFQCGIAINAVTDWEEIAKDRNSYLHDVWFEREKIAGARTGAEFSSWARETSPVSFAEKISAPLFLVHNDSPGHAPIRGAKSVAATLKKAGRVPATFFYGDGPWDRSADAKRRAQIYERAEKFLQQHLAGSPNSPAK